MMKDNGQFAVFEQKKFCKEVEMVEVGTLRNMEDVKAKINNMVFDLNVERILPSVIVMPESIYRLLWASFQSGNFVGFDNPEGWAKGTYDCDLIHHKMIFGLGIF